MWYSQDKQYRAVIRHDDSDWTPDNPGKTGAALFVMFRAGKLEDLVGQANPWFSEKMLKGIIKVTTVILQKRVGKFDWEIMSTGYAFCGKGDQFAKKVGRKIAFRRALDLMSENKHRSVFAGLLIQYVVVPDLGKTAFGKKPQKVVIKKK